MAALVDMKKHPAAAWIGLALIAVALAALPFALAAIGTAWVRITNLAILFVLLSLGLNIVVGFAGLLDLGYIAFYAVGAYTYALLASPHFNLHLPFWMILPLGAAVACMFGVLLGAPTLKLRGDYLAIVTLGFGEIVRIFMNNLSQPVNITNGPQGITLIDPFRIGDFNFAKTEVMLGLVFTGPIKYYYFLVLLVLVIIVVNLRLQDSRIGRAWEAIREDEIAARAMGINTRNLKLLAFAMGASFGGISGGIFSATQGFISPESFVLVESIMVLSMVVLGGMGNIWGVILGAVLLSFVPEVLRYTVEPVQRALFGRMLIEPEVIRMLLFGLALVLMMLFRPAGILPSAVRKRELEHKVVPAHELRTRALVAERASTSGSAACKRSPTSRSRSTTARSTGSSARMARGRPACSTSSPGSTRRTAATSPSTAGRSQVSSRTRWRGAASRARSRTSACSPTCRRWRT